jgi:hypothetical protein
VRSPIRLSRTPVRHTLPPPELDEDGAALRRWLADPVPPGQPPLPT